MYIVGPSICTLATVKRPGTELCRTYAHWEQVSVAALLRPAVAKSGPIVTQEVAAVDLSGGLGLVTMDHRGFDNRLVVIFGVRDQSAPLRGHHRAAQLFFELGAHDQDTLI